MVDSAHARSIQHPTFNTEHSTFQKEKERNEALLSNQSLARKTDLREKSLLLQFLTVDAVGRPGDGSEALLADRGAAVRAGAEGFVLEAGECLIDQHEEVALAVVEREVQLLRV